MPDVLRHLRHANQVRGGALLFSDDRIGPILSPEEFLDERKVGRRPLSDDIKVEKAGTRVRRWANGAESVRALKRAHGVPVRPTDSPVDDWGMGR